MIVVDTSPFFHGPMLATLDRTDELLLVCGLEVPTIKNVRLEPADAGAALLPAEPDPDDAEPGELERGLKRSEVEAALETKVSFELPSDRAVPLSVNRGQPAVLAEPGCDFARAIKEWRRRSSKPQRERGQRRRRWIPSLAKA